MCSLLTSEEILSLGKEVLLNKLHSYIRLWYIQKQLPDIMIGDPDIIPFYTPCNGHSSGLFNTSETRDVIDGFLPMQAYCKTCSQTRNSH